MSNNPDSNNRSDELKLRTWIDSHRGTEPLVQHGIDPYGARPKSFMLTTLPLKEVNFKDHRFNPRTPNQGKVNELVASISSLTLLTPLTCAYIGIDEDAEKDLEEQREEVVLLDGRHRFKALDELRKEYPDWAMKTNIDLKIYFDLKLSDIYLLSTYLNKTRKALAKGEYYKFVVEIYEKRLEEMMRADRKVKTEEEVFQDINARELADKHFDLSIGRIVGKTAFDEEEGTSWYPMVGIRQQDKIKDGNEEGKYCPITAGNMATFLGHLCNKKAYKDHGEMRSIEIANVLELGVKLRVQHILQPVDDFNTATGTTVAFKHWPLDAFGSLIETVWIGSLVKAKIGQLPLLAHTSLRWERIKELLQAYYDIMSNQAPLINEFRSLMKVGELDEAAKIRNTVWSYQTQSGQIEPELKKEIEGRLDWLRE